MYIYQIFVKLDDCIEWIFFLHLLSLDRAIDVIPIELMILDHNTDIEKCLVVCVCVCVCFNTLDYIVSSIYYSSTTVLHSSQCIGCTI